MEINYNKVIENDYEKEFYVETHDKILEYLIRNQKSTFWEIVRNVQGSDRRVLRLLEQMRLVGEIQKQGVQISSSGDDVNGAYSNDVSRDASNGDVYSPPVTNFSLNEKYQEILEKMQEIDKNKPKTTFVYDQRPVTLKTTVKRVAYLDYKGELKDKSIVVIGDDDLTSLAIGLTREAKEVVVFDIDERLIDFINSVAKEYNLNVTAYQYDLTKQIPEEFREKFDVFLTDPTPIKEAFELFVSIGLSLLKTGKGKVGYISFFPSHQPISTDFQEVLERRNVIVTDMIPKFTEYQFIPETYTKEDLELLKEYDSEDEKLNFYENHTRIETTEETDRSIIKLKDSDQITGKATKRILENPELDPAYAGGKK